MPVPAIAREPPGARRGRRGADGGASLLLVAGVPLALVAAGAIVASRRTRMGSEQERRHARS